MYITDEMIDDRAGLTHFTREEFENRSHWRDTAEQELEQEHMWQIFSAWDEALKFLVDEPNKDEIVEVLLKGWTDEDGVWDSDGLVCEAIATAFFNEWEVRRAEDQWLFTHVNDGTKFFDIDLLAGLQACDLADREPRAQREALIRNLNLDAIQVIKLERFEKAVADESKFKAEQQIGVASGVL